ncbi:hypothetical protein CJ179_32730 [Rhodococcus sp. ACS1]|uniref:hypothetical protein n=1 Tax=Rhodococcus TaxID=1827 RepID=UPI000BB11204|nr:MULTISPECIES: hypothetical protein [Rhodococcus]PBC39921.1 hypothetical protein CJ179_32730 [Rhodococcus sp. ACS1]QSE77844.1 hypothetical protein JWS14_00970 [Rhodococcus koreensis]
MATPLDVRTAGLTKSYGSVPALDEPTGRLDPLRRRFSITAPPATISALIVVVGCNRWDMVR